MKKNNVERRKYSSLFRPNYKTLEENLRRTEILKKELISKIRELKEKYEDEEITYSEYEYMINGLLQGKSLEYWLNYYDNYKNETKLALEEYKLTEKNKVEVSPTIYKPIRPRRRYALPLALGLFFLMFLIAFMQPQITGHFFVEPESVILKWNNTWNVENSILRVSMNNNYSDYSVVDFLIDDEIVLDVSKFEISGPGTMYVDLIVDYEVVDSKIIEITEDIDSSETEDLNETVDDLNETIDDLNETIVDDLNETIDDLNETIVDDLNETIDDLNETIIDDLNETIIDDLNETIDDLNETIIDDLNETIIDDLNETIDDLNETIIDDLNETIIDDLNETIIDDLNETIIDDLNETIIDDLNETIDEIIENITLKNVTNLEEKWFIDLSLEGNSTILFIDLINETFVENDKKIKDKKLSGLEIDSIICDNQEKNYSLINNTINLNVSACSESTLIFNELIEQEYNLFLRYGKTNLTVVLSKIYELSSRGCGLANSIFAANFRDIDCRGITSLIKRDGAKIRLNNQKISGNGKDIGLLVASSRISIENGAVENFEQGIVIEGKGRKDFLVKDLKINNNRQGLIIRDVENVTLENVEIIGNEEYGLILENVNQVNFYNVEVRDSKGCVMIKDSRLQNVELHTHGCTDYGVLYDLNGKIIKMVNPK